VRSYEFSIFAQPSRKTKDDGKVPAANMAFTEMTRGRDKKAKRCRICKKPGYLAKECWYRAKKSGGKKGPRGGSTKPGNSDPPAKENRSCYVCGKLGHITKDCDCRISKPSQEEGEGRKRKFAGSNGAGGRSSWYSKGTKPYHDRNSEENDSDIGNMFTEVVEYGDKSALYDDSLVMNYAESSEPFGEDEVVLVDSACNVLAINKERLFSNLDKSKTRKIKTAQRKSVVLVKGVGDVGALKNAYWCPDSSENLCGVNVLKDMGYTVILDDYCTIVDRDTDATVVQTAAINGIYVIYLNQLIHLQEQNLKMNSAVEEEDDL
jgi:hypothetical protein